MNNNACSSWVTELTESYLAFVSMSVKNINFLWVLKILTIFSSESWIHNAINMTIRCAFSKWWLAGSYLHLAQLRRSLCVQRGGGRSSSALNGNSQSIRPLGASFAASHPENRTRVRPGCITSHRGLSWFPGSLSSHQSHTSSLFTNVLHPIKNRW